MSRKTGLENCLNENTVKQPFNVLCSSSLPLFIAVSSLWALVVCKRLSWSGKCRSWTRVRASSPLGIVWNGSFCSWTIVLRQLSDTCHSRCWALLAMIIITLMISIKSSRATKHVSCNGIYRNRMSHKDWKLFLIRTRNMHWKSFRLYLGNPSKIADSNSHSLLHSDAKGRGHFLLLQISDQGRISINWINGLKRGEKKASEK